MKVKQFIETLRRIANRMNDMADYAEKWVNVDGHKTGWDSHMNKEWDGIHAELLKLLKEAPKK